MPLPMLWTRVDDCSAACKSSGTGGIMHCSAVSCSSSRALRRARSRRSGILFVCIRVHSWFEFLSLQLARIRGCLLGGAVSSSSFPLICFQVEIDQAQEREIFLRGEVLSPHAAIDRQ